MPDLDAFHAGGATGAMSRAAQMQALAASNAAQLAARLMRKKPPPPRPRSPFLPPIQGPMLGPPMPPPKPRAAPYDMGLDRSDDFREFRNGQDMFGQSATPPGATPFFDQNGVPAVIAPTAPNTAVKEPKPVKPSSNVASKGIQLQAEGTGLKTASSMNSRIIDMLEDFDRDPLQDGDRRAMGKELAAIFQEKTRNKLFSKEDLFDNPMLRTLNDLSAWSRYRRQVADWHASKNKVEGAESVTDPGDGTFSGLVQKDSFASVTSPSNLSPYIVIRDESGLLTVVNADQWIQGKYTDMRKDPRYAAQLITALAMTSAYGTDSNANAQASRVALDKNGNPVKAIAGEEDLKALKSFANSVAIWQANGEEVSADDSLAELARLGRSVTDQNAANGEYGGGGGGGYGGGGGGGGAVRYTDPALLAAQLDSIARTRTGQSLTPDQHAQFVQYFHQLEAQNQAAYMAGQPFTDLDPQAQAIKWIEDHFKKEAATQQYGNLAARFFEMMGSSNPFAGL